MKCLTLAFALTAAWTSALTAQVGISGPTEQVTMGQPVELVAQTGEWQLFQWLTEVDKKQYRLYEEGKTLAFWPPSPGRYHFGLAVSRINKTDDQEPSIEGETFSFYVVVEGSKPEPGPRPGPGPGPKPKPEPEPKVPDTPLGLAKLCYETATKEVPSVGNDAWKTAGVYRGLGSQIKAGSGPSGQAGIIKEAISRLKDSLGSKRYADWTPWLNNHLAPELGKLEVAGKLKTDSQIADAFLEIATGLEVIRRVSTKPEE